MSSPYTQEQIDDALTALIAFARNASAAVRYLKSEGKRAPAGPTLLDWSRTKHWERYEELREKFADKHEKTLANDYLDAARAATEVQALAVRVARERLEQGKDEDPARTAANLSRVAQSATDKRLSLQGRPTSITENRDATEIMRGLLAKHPGLFSLAETTEAVALPEGSNAAGE